VPLDVEPWTADAISCVLVPFRRYCARPGQYAGSGTVLATTGTTRVDTTPLQVDDWIRLTEDDGANVAGIYAWDGASYVWAEGLPQAPSLDRGQLTIEGLSPAVVQDGLGGYLLTPGGLVEAYDDDSLIDVEVLDTATGGGLYWALKTCKLRATTDSSTDVSPASLEPEGLYYEISVTLTLDDFQWTFSEQFEIDAATDYDSVLIDDCIPVALIRVGGAVSAAQDLFDQRLLASPVMGWTRMWSGSSWDIVSPGDHYVQLAGDPSPPSVLGDIVYVQP